MSEDVSVIIVAAGRSSRAGGIKKQFMELEGVPVLVRSIRKFHKLAQVKEIIVAASEQDIEYVKHLCLDFGLDKVNHIAAGGNTRQQSVFNSFELCDTSCGLVAIHDAARPFVNAEDIVRVLRQASQYGAAVLGAPVKDTIKTVENGMVLGTPDRACLYQAQTPQAFRMELYKQCIMKAKREGLECTDDSQLAEAAGIPVAMVTGSYANIKITTPEDIVLARYLAKEEGN